MKREPDRPQYQFDLSAERPDYSRKGFLLTDTTRVALATLDAFLGSTEHALAICGPKGSGKTHLVHIAAKGGEISAAVQLPSAPTGALTVLDDADRASSPTALLDLFEVARMRSAKLILAGEGSPGDWAKGLRDLKTRLEAIPRITLEQPDEALLQGVIGQLFRRRQWQVSRAVPSYAAPRISRTFAAAKAFVDAAGAEAIDSGRPITLALARKVVDNLSEAPPAA